MGKKRKITQGGVVQTDNFGFKPNDMGLSTGPSAFTLDKANTEYLQQADLTSQMNDPLAYNISADRQGYGVRFGRTLLSGLNRLGTTAIGGITDTVAGIYEGVNYMTSDDDKSYMQRLRENDLYGALDETNKAIDEAIGSRFYERREGVADWFMSGQMLDDVVQGAAFIGAQVLTMGGLGLGAKAINASTKAMMGAQNLSKLSKATSPFLKLTGVNKVAKLATPIRNNTALAMSRFTEGGIEARGQIEEMDKKLKPLVEQGYMSKEEYNQRLDKAQSTVMVGNMLLAAVDAAQFSNLFKPLSKIKKGVANYLNVGKNGVQVKVPSIGEQIANKVGLKKTSERLLKKTGSSLEDKVTRLVKKRAKLAEEGKKRFKFGPKYSKLTTEQAKNKIIRDQIIKNTVGDLILQGGSEAGEEAFQEQLNKQAELLAFQSDDMLDESIVTPLTNAFINTAKVWEYDANTIKAAMLGGMLGGGMKAGSNLRTIIGTGQTATRGNIEAAENIAKQYQAMATVTDTYKEYKKRFDRLKNKKYDTQEEFKKAVESVDNEFAASSGQFTTLFKVTDHPAIAKLKAQILSNKRNGTSTDTLEKQLVSLQKELDSKGQSKVFTLDNDKLKQVSSMEKIELNRLVNALDPMKEQGQKGLIDKELRIKHANEYVKLAAESGRADLRLKELKQLRENINQATDQELISDFGFMSKEEANEEIDIAIKTYKSALKNTSNLLESKVYQNAKGPIKDLLFDLNTTIHSIQDLEKPEVSYERKDYNSQEYLQEKYKTLDEISSKIENTLQKAGKENDYIKILNSKLKSKNLKGVKSLKSLQRKDVSPIDNVLNKISEDVNKVTLDDFKGIDIEKFSLEEVQKDSAKLDSLINNLSDVRLQGLSYNKAVNEALVEANQEFSNKFPSNFNVVKNLEELAIRKQQYQDSGKIDYDSAAKMYTYNKKQNQLKELQYEYDLLRNSLSLDEDYDFSTLFKKMFNYDEFAVEDNNNVFKGVATSNNPKEIKEYEISAKYGAPINNSRKGYDIVRNDVGKALKSSLSNEDKEGIVDRIISSIDIDDSVHNNGTLSESDLEGFVIEQVAKKAKGIVEAYYNEEKVSPKSVEDAANLLNELDNLSKEIFTEEEYNQIKTNIKGIDVEALQKRKEEAESKDAVSLLNNLTDEQLESLGFNLEELQEKAERYNNYAHDVGLEKIRVTLNLEQKQKLKEDQSKIDEIIESANTVEAFDEALEEASINNPKLKGYIDAKRSALSVQEIKKKVRKEQESLYDDKGVPKAKTIIRYKDNKPTPSDQKVEDWINNNPTHDRWKLVEGDVNDAEYKEYIDSLSEEEKKAQAPFLQIIPVDEKGNAIKNSSGEEIRITVKATNRPDFVSPILVGAIFTSNSVVKYKDDNKSGDFSSLRDKVLETTSEEEYTPIDFNFQVSSKKNPTGYKEGSVKVTYKGKQFKADYIPITPDLYGDYYGMITKSLELFSAAIKDLHKDNTSEQYMFIMPDGDSEVKSWLDSPTDGNTNYMANSGINFNGNSSNFSLIHDETTNTYMFTADGKNLGLGIDKTGRYYQMVNGEMNTISSEDLYKLLEEKNVTLRTNYNVHGDNYVMDNDGDISVVNDVEHKAHIAENVLQTNYDLTQNVSQPYIDLSPLQKAKPIAKKESKSKPVDRVLDREATLKEFFGEGAVELFGSSYLHPNVMLLSDEEWLERLTQAEQSYIEPVYKPTPNEVKPTPNEVDSEKLLQEEKKTSSKKKLKIKPKKAETPGKLKQPEKKVAQGLNVDEVASAVEETAQTSTKAEPNIEAEKAKIQRRRQEEIDNALEVEGKGLTKPENTTDKGIEKIDKRGTIWNPSDKVFAEFIPVPEEYKEGNVPVIVKQKKPQINTNGVMTQSAEVVIMEFSSLEEGQRYISENPIKVNPKRIKKINAKYDAELKALKTEAEPSSVEVDVSGQTYIFKDGKIYNKKNPNKEIYKRDNKSRKQILEKVKSKKATKISTNSNIKVSRYSNEGIDKLSKPALDAYRLIKDIREDSIETKCDI